MYIKGQSHKIGEMIEKDKTHLFTVAVIVLILILIAISLWKVLNIVKTSRAAIGDLRSSSRNQNPLAVIGWAGGDNLRLSQCPLDSPA